MTERVRVSPDSRVEHATRRAAQAAGARRRRRRLTVLLLAVLLLVGGLVGGGLSLFGSLFGAADFEGAGGGEVIVQVHDGDSTTQIGGTLTERGVVASTAAFTRAAATDGRVRSVQPGYYQLRSRMAAAVAVSLLLDPAARVGQLEIRGGVQLDDTRTPDGTVQPGVLSLIAAASCATIDGAQRCVRVEELRAAMTDTDPARLGVPSWAVQDVGRVEPARRLEGLLAPGRYDVEPGTPAVEVLRRLLASSVARLEDAGLVSGARSIGSTPYQVLVISSLVEKEGITADMPAVARVIYNRLGIGQRLELDSTVNYPLDLQALRTDAAVRARPGPYNSYLNTGLPPTPISAPGRAAIAAAVTPAAGPWLFFVRCRADGASCFAETLAEHQANVADAVRNGAI